MKSKLVTLVLIALFTNAAQAQEEIKIGAILGFTGPIESLTPPMVWGAELAAKEVNDSGMLLDGATVSIIRADSTCIDSAAATAAAERLITSDLVHAIMGADCSGVTSAILQNVARPNGIVMISPSATSPGLSIVEDDGLFFRTAPSDARQGQVMAEIIQSRGFSNVAVTYSNTDYGKGLSDSFVSAFTNLGGTVTITASHEDNRGDYAAEVGTLAAAGGDALVVIGYVDQGGRGIIQASIDTGAFDIFVLPDGMFGESLVRNFGDAINGSFGQLPGTDSVGGQYIIDKGTEEGVDGSSAFVSESYDSTALILLAMQAAKSSMSSNLKNHVFDVANAPGEPILPGELAKGLAILASGGGIDYVGASDVELIGPGEASGKYREFEIIGGQFETVGYR